MALELDHVFICCSIGAPEADALVRLGLREGSPNTHLGQGTANRRFFFCNALLELLWVSDPLEARSEQTRRTRLWERWSERGSGACPFGVALRPSGAREEPAPFETWSYHPAYLPPPLAIEFAEGLPLQEPELAYLPFAHRTGPAPGEPTDHAIPIREIRGVTVALPSGEHLSAPSRTAQATGLVSYRTAREHLLELDFVGPRELVFDLRPALPLVFRGVPRSG